MGESGDVTSYSYDALNRRIAKISAGRRTDYRYDGLAVLEEVSPDGLEKIYNRTRGRVVSQQQYSTQNGIKTPEKELYYAYDALGSVVALTSSNGSTETRYHYDAFGKLIDGDISENEYTYTGQRLDPEC